MRRIAIVTHLLKRVFVMRPAAAFACLRAVAPLPHPGHKRYPCPSRGVLKRHASEIAPALILHADVYRALGLHPSARTGVHTTLCLCSFKHPPPCCASASPLGLG